MELSCMEIGTDTEMGRKTTISPTLKLDLGAGTSSITKIGTFRGRERQLLEASMHHRCGVSWKLKGYNKAKGEWIQFFQMHHLSSIFDIRKKSTRMDQTLSPKPKLVRRYAAKNFDFTPAASMSTSQSKSSPPAYRTRSLDLPLSVDRTSLRIDGSNSEVDSIFHSLGLSGPEDF